MIVRPSWETTLLVCTMMLTRDWIIAHISTFKLHSGLTTINSQGKHVPAQNTILHSVCVSEWSGKLHESKIFCVNITPIFQYHLCRKFYEEEVEKNMQKLASFLVILKNDHNFDGQYGVFEYKWTLPNAILFTMTTLTMIGYGNIAPRTDNGKID